MPKVLFFSDPSNGRPGLGATILLDSSEPCLVSIAPGWVRVKKSRTGFFGRTLYNVRNRDETTETARALTYLYPDSRLPSGITDPLLCSFANAIFHCSTCSEVANVLNGAIVRLERQFPLDREIVFDVADFMQDSTIRPDVFYDVSALPHPKEAIIVAIERQILTAPNQKIIDSLVNAQMFLWNFLDGVGDEPLPSLGVEIGPPHSGEMTPEALDQLRREADLIVNNPNAKRAEQFRAISCREAELINQRIAAAVRLRERLALL
jgi:hypothetical protein